MTQPIATSSISLALAADGAAPEWVQLFPAGPEIRARDGRVFQMVNPQAVIAAFREGEADLPIDVEHASQTRAEQGLEAPAYGWITEIEDRSGALWGKVDWTAQGAEWVKGKAYRYLSPAFGYVKKTGEITRLIAAGLTNGPAFKMAALARAETSEPETEENDTMKTVLEALGLAATASEADAVAAITTLQTDVATAKAAQPDPEKYIARAQYDAAAKELGELRDAATAREEKELADLVDAAVEDGKIIPAVKDEFLATAKAMGVESFSAMVEKMPVVATARPAPAAATATATAGALTEEEKAVAKALGQSEEDYAAAKKAAAEETAK